MNIADLSIDDRPADAREGGIESPIESDLQIDAGLLDDREGPPDALGIEIYGFLAENDASPVLGTGDSDFGMDGSISCDADDVEVLLVQQFLPVSIGGKTGSLREALSSSFVPAASGDEVDPWIIPQREQVRPVEVVDVLTDRIAGYLVRSADEPSSSAFARLPDNTMLMVSSKQDVLTRSFD